MGEPTQTTRKASVEHVSAAPKGGEDWVADPKKAARKAIVERVDVYKRSDYDDEFSDRVGDGHPEVWIAQISLREGIDQSPSHSVFFHSESEAIKYAQAHPVGSEFNGSNQDAAETEDSAKMTVCTYVDDGYFPNSKNGLILSSLPMVQLLEAGIFVREGGESLLLYDTPLSGRGPIPVLSKIVLDFIGHQRVSDLKERFGREWEFVAAWEYCWVKFPRSSLAYIASAYGYNHFVLRDEMTAGYLLRDLEILAGGIEAEAVKVADRRKRGTATTAGSHHAALWRMAGGP